MRAALVQDRQPPERRARANTTNNELPMTDLYLGNWLLIPELSLYQAGDPPAAGKYSIERDGDGELRLRVDWLPGKDAAWLNTSFGGPADGTPQSLEGPPGGPDAFTLTRVDERTLDSAALRNGETIAYARRVASSDGKLLAVVQEARAGDQLIRNFQVYRRADAT